MPRVIKVSHIGIATADRAGALRLFSEGFGLPIGASEDVPGDAVRVTFLPVGESRIELLEPVGEKGPIQRFLESRGPGIHHICLEVEDLPGMLRHLHEQGVALIDQEPRPGAHGTLVAFLHPKSTNGVLIELVESTSLHREHGGH
ncbi:MAG TPA: methylmalonyl-CoA epimerase [Chloroflexia bacterium]|nr:methylmalonyl-CoA epimerase [Chloroflexia bacterium]